MNRTVITFSTCMWMLVLGTTAGVAQAAPSDAAGGHRHEYSDEAPGAHEEERTRVHMNQAMVDKSGVTTDTAGPGTLAETVRLYGTLVAPPANHAAVAARYPGRVVSVHVDIGDQVTQGQRLAVVESNASLNSYTLTAPIAGIVQRVNVSVGELAGNEPLFTLLDTRRLWAELKVFPMQSGRVATGQTVRLTLGETSHEAGISSVTPAAGEPFLLARVGLPNDHRRLVPGAMVSADVVVSRTEASLVVRNEALQTAHDKTVVFVPSADGFQARPVRAGRSDGVFTEILEGLNPGDTYVTGNSYLLKADLEKSGAAHSH